MFPILLANSELKNKKSSENPLTFSQKCDRMNMKREEGKPHKPERITTMKKATMNTILTLIATIDTPEAQAVRDELTAELSKGAELKAQNDALYDAAKVVVMDELSKATEAVTIGELYDAVADQLPEGFTKGKLQYAMTRLWKDELVKTEGKVNTYSKA